MSVTRGKPVSERYSQLQKLNALLIVELLRQWAAVTAHDFTAEPWERDGYRTKQLYIINRAAKRVLVEINSSNFKKG